MSSNEEIDKVDLLFEVLKRYDFYINTVNTKLGVILSYCAVVFVGMVIRTSSLYDNLKALDNYIPFIFWGVFGLVVFMELLVIWFAFMTLFPNTTSGNNGDKSLIFYGDVASYTEDKTKYYEKVKKISNESLGKDLSSQVVTVASVLSAKFKMLKNTVIATIVLTVLLLIFVILSMLVRG